METLITINNQTEVFLSETDKWGKITISDVNMGAFNYQWGSMGNDGLKAFIKKIDSDYFAKNLCRYKYEFDAKTSVCNIRRYIRKELSDELPFYKFMELQKEMRKELKKLEYSYDGNDFVARCYNMPNAIYGTPLGKEEKEFDGIINSLFTCEPWHFIGNRTTAEYNWLVTIHGQLKTFL